MDLRISVTRAVAVLATALLAATAAAQSNTPFVSAEFAVPTTLETKEFRLRMLTVNDVVKDYDAVMTSLSRARHRLGRVERHSGRKAMSAFAAGGMQ